MSTVTGKTSLSEPPPPEMFAQVYSLEYVAVTSNTKPFEPSTGSIWNARSRSVVVIEDVENVVPGIGSPGSPHVASRTLFAALACVSESAISDTTRHWITNPCDVLGPPSVHWVRTMVVVSAMWLPRE